MGDKLEQTPLVGTLVSSSEAELEIEIEMRTTSICCNKFELMAEPF